MDELSPSPRGADLRLSECLRIAAARLRASDRLPARVDIIVSFGNVEWDSLLVLF